MTGLELDHVGFTYPKAKRSVLSDVCASFAPGMISAIGERFVKRFLRDFLN